MRPSAPEKILIGGPAGKIEVDINDPGDSRRGIALIAHPHPLIHGELDDVVPLAAVLDWARPQNLPVVVVPGGGHFFHGRLHLLQSIVMQYCRP